MRNKLIEMLANAFDERTVKCLDCFDNDECLDRGYCDVWTADIADTLIANGVTVQTTPISYNRLLKLAKRMHFWIWDHSFDEQKVYDQLGLTEEENYVFGYGGKMEMPLPEAPKEVE